MHMVMISATKLFTMLRRHPDLGRRCRTVQGCVSQAYVATRTRTPKVQHRAHLAIDLLYPIGTT
jgi:hypothetical protein